MARTDQADRNSSRIRTKTNQQVDKANSQLDSLISDALRRIDSLQNRVTAPVKGVLVGIGNIRQRQVRRIQDQVERRIDALNDFRNSILERFGISSDRSARAQSREAADKAQESLEDAGRNSRKKAVKAARTSVETVADKANRGAFEAVDTGKEAASSTRQAAGQAYNATETATDYARDRASSTARSAERAADQAARKAEGGKQASRTQTSAGLGDRDRDLTRIKGIGPVTAQRLQEKGIARIQQVANPSPDEQKVLETFKTGRGLEVWQRNARTVMSQLTKSH